MKVIKGLGTALITPFRQGAVDYLALERIIDYQISGGIDFLVTMGTTGESVTLTQGEKEEVVRFTVEKTRGRVPVVLGLGGNNTSEVAKKMAEVNVDGIEAILSASPAYNKPTQEGICRHYEVLSKATRRPIIIYNVPGRTASNISAETTLRLAQLDMICGVKEASGNMAQGAEIIQNAPDDFSVLSGDDPTAFLLSSLGGDGCISVIANWLPDLFKMAVCFDGWEEMMVARKVHHQLLPLHPWFYVDGNPAGIKAAMAAQGWCANELRLPLVPMSKENEKALLDAIRSYSTAS